VEKLIENIRNKTWSSGEQRAQLDLLSKLNRMHQRGREGDALMESRIQSFELAYRMQMDATDAFDLSKEPQHIRDLYGNTTYGRQCLIARRLAERGVRFVQLWHSPGQPWDSHDDLEINHRRLSRESDQGTAALLIDLKQRGLLDDTLVLWAGEFGRTPVMNKDAGRDHWPKVFSIVLAGGGIKKGFVYGKSDPTASEPDDDALSVEDMAMTVYNQLGIDGVKRLIAPGNRPIDIVNSGKVVNELLA
jgi:uncharacterized protein (DUF1501 family)